MKQATGKTNHLESRFKVSIQLKLGGHSFSVDNLSDELVGTTEAVVFEVLTPKTLLVPSEEFDSVLAGRYLELAGMAATPDEAVVWSDITGPIVAVMTMERTTLDLLRAKLGDRMAFISPLLRHSEFATPTIWLCQEGELLYMKVYDTTLRFADVVPAATEADILFFVEQLSDEFLFTPFTALLSGEQCKRAIKTIRNYFPRVVCE